MKKYKQYLKEVLFWSNEMKFVKTRRECIELFKVWSSEEIGSFEFLFELNGKKFYDTNINDFRGYRNILALDGDKSVFCFSYLNRDFTELKSLSTFPQIEEKWLLLDPDYVGNNFSFELFKFLLKTKMIISDDTHTLPTINIWKKLEEDYKITIFDFDDKVILKDFDKDEIYGDSNKITDYKPYEKIRLVAYK